MSETTSTNISLAQANSTDSAQAFSTRYSHGREPSSTKKICFYKSGDPKFNGIKMVVTNRSFKTFDALLDSLSKKVPLPFGVRNITTPRGLHHVTTLDELEDGKSYICSHHRKIKPINLEKARKKPALWQSSRPISARRRAVQLARQNEVVPFHRENTIVLGSPKKLVIFKNGDTGLKHHVILSKKSTQSFDNFLDQITETLQYPVFKLYSTDGRRILSIRALLMSSGTIVAAGREPFKIANYDSQSDFLPTKLPGISGRVFPKARPKQELRSPGKWKVSVFTSELPSAGTTSQVYITFYGHKRASEPVFLDSNEGEEIFQSGNEDTFFVNIGDIGEIYKIRIGHSNSGISPAWHCEEVQLLDLFSNEQFCIKVNRWLARDQDDGEICRELPVLQHGHAKLPVTKYELRVVTGDLWNAGTEANVYISVHGEYGDTGSRQLFKSSKPMKFVKRQTDTFSLESVHLGDLQTVIIGHDGLEPGNGWYLEKIVIHDPVKDKEYTFFCYRWLDEGEDDRNIVRKLYVADESEFPARQELELKKKQIWSAERWKFQKGNTLHFYCKATRKFIRLTPDGKVDALAEKKDKYGFFDVTAKRGNVRVFNSHHISHLALAIDKGIVTAMDNSGILCELQVHLQLNRCVILESTRVPGLTVSFSSDGDPANGNTSGYARISKEFVVHVKGMFHHGAILLLTTSWSQALCIRYGGHCSGAGNQNEESYWRVHKISSSVYMFESVKSPMQYLRIKNGKCDGEGRGDEYCQFKVEKNLENGSVTLESVRNRGIYVGLLPTGLAKPVVQTGESNVMFFPKVIKFGREKPMGTSATPSLKKEEINKDKDMEEQGLVARSPSVSPSLRKREEATLRSHEDSLHRSTEWKVLVLTGSVGTSASVTLWVYGSKGTSGPITLGNDNKEQLFLPRQEDEFMVKMPNIGKLYKIRIEHDGTNDQSEWKLKHINLQKMKTGKTYSFEVNRWLSRTRENCDIVYELPAVENGEFLYPIVKYQVNVYTGLLEHADTDAPVYICIYGERGDSGRRILYKSNWPKKFQKGQVDVFEIEAVSLGKLHQVLLGCEANQKSQYWYCEKVIIREQGKDSEYIFSCERWLPFMSQNILQSHIKLPVQELQTSKMKEHNEENEGDWKITVVTGSLHQAATDATVFLYVYGEKADSGPIILGSGEHQLFDLNSSDTFKINLSHIGKIYKLRIGHDSSGNNPIWYLEEVKLKNIASNEEFHLPVNRWLGEEKDDGDTWRELPLLRDGEPQLALLDYKIYVYTGSIPDAGTESNVYINLFGTRGDSGKRKLHKNENQQVKFQKGQVDIFCIQAVSLGMLKKIQISHDGTGPENGWFLDKVKIKYTEDGSDQKVLFPCNRWLDICKGDRKTEIELFAAENENPEKEDIKVIQWNIQVKTAKDSLQMEEMKVKLVIYGSEGKSENVLLLPPEHTATCFLPGSKDEFIVESKNVGKVYKIRVTCNIVPVTAGWHLKFLRMIELKSQQEVKFDCDCWLSVGDEDEIIKEFPAVNNGQEQLPVYKYIVAVHTGDHWGAETAANVYVTLYGERGDSGPRKLHKSLAPGEKFTRNKTDLFILEVVSLGDLRKVVLGHDGEGYGAGMYLKMVTAKESRDSTSEWVFPFWNWLDSNLGMCQTVCKLHTIEVSAINLSLLSEFRNCFIPHTPQYNARHEIFYWLLLSRHSDRKALLRAMLDNDLLVLKKEASIRLLSFHEPDEPVDVPPKLLSQALPVPSTTSYPAALEMGLLMSKEEYRTFLTEIQCILSEAFTDFYKDILCTMGDDVLVEPSEVVSAKSPIHIYVYTLSCTGPLLPQVTDFGRPGDKSPAIIYQGKDVLTSPFCQMKSRVEGPALWRVVDLAPGFVHVFDVSPWDPGIIRLGPDEMPLLHSSVFPRSAELLVLRVGNNLSWMVLRYYCTTVVRLVDIITQLNLTTSGRRLCSNPKPHANSGGLWVMDITGCEFDSSASPVYFSIVFFGDKGKEKLKKQIVGNTIQMKEELKSVGSIYKVQICWSNIQVKKEWHLISMHLKQTSTNQEMWLNFDCWMKSNEDSCVELPAIYPDKDPLPVVEYVIYIHTGDVDNTKTSGKVCISIEGENGDTGKRVLNNAGTEVLSFTKGQVDIFRIKAVHLGKLQRIVVGFSNSRKDMWFLEKIIVKEEDFSSTSYVFIYNDWITCKSDTEFTESVIMLKELKEEPKEVKSFSTVTRGQWQMQVLDATTEEKNHDISVVVYGRTGKSQPQRVKKLNYNPFMIQVGDIGEIIKVSFQSMAPSFGRRLQLQKIRLKDVDTKQEIGFYPDLSDHQDSESVIELAAVLPDVSPLANVSYSVRVKTGSIPAAGTDADVSITIYGENGDMCKRKLKHSSYPGVFEKGQVNIFNIKAVDLGMLTKVYIEHNAVGFGAGWYLDQIVIQESDKGHPEFLFPCQQWLDTGISGKQTSCELKLLGKVSETNERLRKSVGGTFNIFVTAVNVTNGAIKNQVYLTICCEKGHYEPVVFTRGSLKEGTTFQSTVDLNQNLGPIQKIRLQMDDNVKGESWYCKELLLPDLRGRYNPILSPKFIEKQVKLQHRQSKETLEFPFLRNFKSDGNSLVAELPVLTPDRPILTVKTYTVYLTTAKSSEKNTDTNFFITLQGSLGDSGRRKPCHGDSEYSIRGKAIGFQLEAVDIGEIQEMIIEKETKTNLQLEKAVVEEGTFIKTKYIFITQKWKNEKKMMSMTLQVTEVKKASITESLNRLMASDGEWNIYLTTSNKVKEEEITETLEYNSKLVIVLYGNKGKSTPFITESKADSPVKDMLIYKINLEQDLGELYKMRLGLENWREDKGGLSVYHLKMQNTQTLDTFSYSNKAYPLSFYGDRWIEVPIEWPLKVSLSVVQYHVTLFYTDIHKQKDGLDLSVCLHGENGDSGDRRLTWQNSQERNEESFTATFDAVDLGEMHHADISMSSKNDHRLNIKYLHVKDLPRNELYRFVVNKEFSVGANESEIREEVLVSADVLRTSNKLNRDRSLESDKKRRSKEQPVEHLIKVYTGDVTGAGTDANVHIVLFSEQDSFGPVQLTQSLEQQNPFERGKVDTFKIKTTNLGKISHIEIGHDGKGVGSGWFLDKIEIVNMSTKEETLFSCNRWLAEDENDGKTVIRLFP
ncbi:oxygen-regulated protein 1 [Rhinophrynus dorsalis]